VNVYLDPSHGNNFPFVKVFRATLVAFLYSSLLKNINSCIICLPSMSGVSSTLCFRAKFTEPFDRRRKVLFGIARGLVKFSNEINEVGDIVQDAVRAIRKSRSTRDRSKALLELRDMAGFWVIQKENCNNGLAKITPKMDAIMSKDHFDLLRELEHSTGWIEIDSEEMLATVKDAIEMAHFVVEPWVDRCYNLYERQKAIWERMDGRLVSRSPGLLIFESSALREWLRMRFS
jgi:hypothetical protein